MTRPVLGYWDLRGRAEVLRLILHYAGVDYEDKFYVHVKDQDCQEWKTDKENLGFDFPNLPYYIEGDKKLTETSAILKYLARKHKLAGDGKEDTILTMETMESVIGDMFLHFAMTCYNPEYENIKETYRTTRLLPALERISKFLAKRGTKWFAGNALTYVDFLAYNTLDWQLHFDPSCLDKHDNLRQFHGRFRELPGIKEYIASDEFKRMEKRLFSRMAAAFGGD